MRSFIGALAIATALLAGGAAPPQQNRPACVWLPHPNLAAARSIRFSFGRIGAILGVPRDEYHFDLSAAGPCRATVTHNDGQRTTYDLPAGAFTEIRQALSAADFFSMKKNSAPEALFENDVSWMTVTCDGEFEHHVCVTHPAPAPNGFEDLFGLAQRLLDRAKPAGKDTPPVLSRPPLAR